MVASILADVGGDQAPAHLSRHHQREVDRVARARQVSVRPGELIAAWMSYDSMIFGDPREAELRNGLEALGEADVAAIRAGIRSAISGPFRSSAFTQAGHLCIVLGRIGGEAAKTLLLELVELHEASPQVQAPGT